MKDEIDYRLDPLDLDMLRLRAQVKPSRRWQALLDAREFIVGIIRGRLRQRYPELSTRELNLKVLEEIDRAKRIAARSESVL